MGEGDEKRVDVKTGLIAVEYRMLLFREQLFHSEKATIKTKSNNKNKNFKWVGGGGVGKYPENGSHKKFWKNIEKFEQKLWKLLLANLATNL